MISCDEVPRARSGDKKRDILYINYTRAVKMFRTCPSVWQLVSFLKLKAGLVVKSAQNLYGELYFAQFRPFVLHQRQPKLYKLVLH